MLNSFFECFYLCLEDMTLELTVSEDLAIRRYQYELTLMPKDGGEPDVMKGHRLHILRQESDGTWRFIKDMWS